MNEGKVAIPPPDPAIARGRIQIELPPGNESSCGKRRILVLAAVTAEGDVEALGREVHHAAAELRLHLHIRVQCDEARDDVAKERRAEIWW
jgi:hypothetical protein